MIVVVMGVAGAGKTTVGRALAARLGLDFLDADDLHDPACVARMGRGEPLPESERAAWIERVAARVEGLRRSGRSAVVACSALRRPHRERLGVGRGDVRLVHLRASPWVLRRRLEARPGHYFGAELLASQLATLEEPERALVVDADAPVERIVAQLARALGGAPVRE